MQSILSSQSHSSLSYTAALSGCLECVRLLFWDWVAEHCVPNQSSTDVYSHRSPYVSFPLSPVISIINVSYRVFPSVYVVFPSIMASDGCRQIGKGYGPITTSFPPGELSTISMGGLATKVFNFADLPCPPSDVDIPPGDTYAPLIAPPSFLFELDPAFSTCIPAYAQGVVALVDPPGGHTPVHQTAEVSDLLEFPPRRRDLGVSGWGPTKTAGPTLKAQL